MKREEISARMKDRIADSLMRFMAERPFEKISVADLLRDCDIARPTFYYHFEDIYDLKNWMFDREAQNLLSQNENCETYVGVRLMLQYVQEHEAFCRNVLRSPDFRRLEHILYLTIRPSMDRLVAEAKVDADADLEEFIADFYARVFVSEVISWMNTGMNRSPDELIDILSLILKGTIPAALRRSVDGDGE